jgi:hypothetical protein
MANGINKKFFDFDLLKRVLRFAAPYKRRFYWSIVVHEKKNFVFQQSRLGVG